jgi:hypothetical protein
MEPSFSSSNQASQEPTYQEIESLLKILLKPFYGAKIDKVLPMYSSSAGDWPLFYLV